MPGCREEEGSRELMSPGSGKQEAKELQCIGINVGLRGCIVGKGNPGTQPLPVWGIDGRPSRAEAYVN